MTIKTCHNCKNCHSWYEPSTYWEPSDSGWECKLELDTADDYPTNVSDVKLAEHFAKDCPSYEYQPELPEPPDDFIEPDPELNLLADIMRSQSMGLLDKDGLPTESFFELV